MCLKKLFHKWRQREKRWTILLTSGAQSSIRQYDLSKSLFYITFMMLAVSIVVTIVASFWVPKLVVEKESLTGSLREQKQEVEEIEESYRKLEREAASMQESVERFKAFEEELVEMDIDVPIDIENGVSGSGGPRIPANVVDASREELPERMDQLNDELPKLVEDFKETIDQLIRYQEELQETPVHPPTNEGQLTSEYGNRRDPLTGQTSFHSGIDIAASMNTPIYAAADGKVVGAGVEGGYGKTVRINHSETYKTLYAHLNQIHVTVGQEVEQGEKIGGMGTTGRSTGVHLHYEIFRNGVEVDPYMYMTFFD
ncbi:M23 family metallopeptidase [Texcoconibacillus texcoconensis]|uniref:Murein DD-endopeptidase MepM/ murein hydrolase activator NlpD n=1 Tax=Texcoconibacillus texcoconensis TaxID=1095777 RepID=A0A840QPQ0_9BACI|nr:M23 family metallopeptidase [Texcoconibacillus texcoconensis]MBB5173311.1 murein DD-endopeptidase MepM/ murein hydrolase activator NlpD [Texcoconibacillus texcoconensis]